MEDSLVTGHGTLMAHLAALDAGLVSSTRFASLQSSTHLASECLPVDWECRL